MQLAADAHALEVEAVLNGLDAAKVLGAGGHARAKDPGAKAANTALGPHMGSPAAKQLG